MYMYAKIHVYRVVYVCVYIYIYVLLYRGHEEQGSLRVPLKVVAARRWATQTAMRSEMLFDCM